MQKSKKGHNSAMTSPTEKKKYGFAYFLGVDFSRSTNSLIFFLEFIF